MTEKIKFDVYDYPDGHEFTVVPCEYCGTYYEPGGKEHKCKKKPKPPKQTNFDKITSSVENLANFIAQHMACYNCAIHKNRYDCKPTPTNNCLDIVKEWLQQEAD